MTIILRIHRFIFKEPICKADLLSKCKCRGQGTCILITLPLNISHFHFLFSLPLPLLKRSCKSTKQVLSNFFLVFSDMKWMHFSISKDSQIGLTPPITLPWKGQNRMFRLMWREIKSSQPVLNNNTFPFFQWSELTLRNDTWALAGVAQWIERPPTNHRIYRFDSQSGSMPGLQARSPVGGAQEATTHWFFLPSLSCSLLLCLEMDK